MWLTGELRVALMSGPIISFNDNVAFFQYQNTNWQLVAA